jgi:hypothetical protein
MKPIFAVEANGADVTALLSRSHCSINLVDKRELEADDLTLVLADPDHRIAWPQKGANLSVYMGWETTGLVHMGRFVVDTVEETGPPDTLTIRALSANFAQSIKAERDLSYSAATLGTIIRTVAERNGLTPAIEDGLAALGIPHVDQTTESDANLVARLAKPVDAIAAVKAEHLLFLPIGYPSTVNGIALPEITIDRSEGDGHTFRQTDAKARYSGVRAWWQDHHAGKDHAVLAGNDFGEVKTLRTTYATAAEAERAADATLKAMGRAEFEMTINLAVGRPDLIANSPVRLTGWRPEINAREWLATEVTHSLDDQGYRNAVKLEERRSVFGGDGGD